MSAANYLVESLSAGHTDDIWTLKYASTSRVISGSADGTLKLWDAAQPDDAICTMKPTPKKGKRSLAIVGMDVQKNVASPEYAIACTLDSVISRFNIQGRQDDEDLGKEEANYALPPSPSTSSSSSSSTKSSPSFTHGQAWCISIHPDPSAAVFATSGLGGYIKVLSSNVDDFGKERMSIPSRGEFVTCAYSPDGRIVASGTSEGQISLVDAETGQLVQFWTGHIGNVRSLAFSPDSSLIITGGDDKQINVFDIRGVQTSKDTQQSSISSYNNNGNYSMRSRRGGGSGQQVANLQGHTGWVLGLSCRDDGRVFASSSSDGTIKLWDLARPGSACLGTLKDHESDVWALDWAPVAPMATGVSRIEGINGGGLGGGRLVSGGKDGQIRWWRGTG